MASPEELTKTGKCISKNVSGIYLIYNTENGKGYIGSARRMKRRMLDHIYNLNLNKHHNSHLQAAWNKYGDEAFLFYCIAETQELTKEEQRVIDELQPEMLYNVKIKDITRFVGFKHTEEAKRKISESHKGKIISAEHRKILSEVNKGNKNAVGAKRNVSQETRAKLSKVNKGRKRTEETKKKMSEAAKKRGLSENFINSGKNILKTLTHEERSRRSKKSWETRRKNGNDKLTSEHKEKISKANRKSE